jgi:hypothetical protein
MPPEKLIRKSVREKNNMNNPQLKTAMTVVGLLILLVFCRPRAEAQEGLTIAGMPVYAVQNNGDLLWFGHIGFQSGGSRWANKAAGKRVAAGWSPSASVFKGDPRGKDGVIYRLASNGDLFWYKHYGYGNGANSWENGKRIANGWSNSRQVGGGGYGIFYCLMNDGSLYWQRHEGYRDGAPVWSNRGVARKIGAATDNIMDPVTGRITNVGWGDAKFIFSGGDATLYMIDNKGDLYWNKHLGSWDGANKWETRKKIGRGWQNMRAVFAGGDGIIYAVNDQGKLLWYQHAGVLNGANVWMKNSGIEVGSGWTADFVF